jgi:hypothetical protein
MRTDGTFDPYIENTTPTQETWLQSHFWGLQTYSPSQDQILSWFAGGYAYVELWGVQPTNPLVQSNPDWVMKDVNGNWLYVNYNCSGGTCSQWAFDFSNPAFIQNLISQQILPAVNAGWYGIWLDDVDMGMHTSDGNGNPVTPVDSNTGLPMTQAAWEQYMANAVTQIRQAVPTTQILHNVEWFAATSQPFASDPAVKQEIQAANILNLERGITGTLSGTVLMSTTSFLSYVDFVHSLGKTVDVQELGFNGDFGLAGYYLISSGLDALSNDAITPNNWWTGYDTNIGTPYGARYGWNGVIRRDFTGGVVLLNPVGSKTATLAAPSGSFVNTSGAPTTSVTLAAGQAAVLIGAYTIPPTPQPVQIDAGGAAVSTFMVDSDFAGGHASTFTEAVNVSGVANAAPEQVYQSRRTAFAANQFTYTVQNLAANHNYTVRLHFCDDSNNVVGARVFNVVINGTIVLSNFDIVAKVGQLKADVQSFSINSGTAGSGSTGQIVIQFIDGTTPLYALVNGIEILPEAGSHQQRSDS